MEIPVDVFYAVVYDDTRAKKSRSRRTFTGFVALEAGKSATSNVPTLFKTQLEAENLLLRARTENKLEHLTFDVEVVRLTESSWYVNTGLYDDSVRIRDARRLAHGMMHYTGIAEQVKKLAGKVLTILDAAYVNENQNKAVKDLVKSSFRSQLGEIHRGAHEDPDCESCEGGGEKDILD
jgi:hypothetical protein